MSIVGPSNRCPRCNTLLPGQATSCGRCGLPLPASAPGALPAGQPGTSLPGSAPADPGASPTLAEALPQKSGAISIITLLFVLVVLVGSGSAAWFLFLNPGRCSGPLFDRHGLPSNVPLPSGCVFQLQPVSQTDTNADRGIQATLSEWIWTVTGSDRAAVQSFYFKTLGSNGWSSLRKGTLPNGNTTVVACQGSQFLEVAVGLKIIKGTGDIESKPLPEIDAPGGGSVFGIALITADNAGALLYVQGLCGGNVGDHVL